MRLALYRYCLPLARPLVLRGRRLDERAGLLLQLGSGWGEVAPLPGFSRESLDEAQAEASHCLGILAAGGVPAPRLPSVCFGLACARRAWPERPPPLPAPYPLLPDDPEARAVVTANWRERTPAVAKLKVARGPLAEELAQIRRLCRDFPALQLVLDANRGWTRAQALAFGRSLDPARILYLEDPCETVADMALVAARTGLAVALDEPLARGDAWHPFAGLAALVLKPTLLGGPDRCARLVGRARRHGLRVIVSSSFESGLGLAQLAGLAAEWAPGQAPGLDTAGWLAADVLGADGRPDPARLECLHEAR
ncbi:o-succinylbenzoate synthase [Zobellella sp. DQSA1]|uniref:o-succinylbenzoate synthase n=1 Tax=Zobellella sp. DQSA1 TaxID=3342386 RepID=UPI0035C1F505